MPGSGPYARQRRGGQRASQVIGSTTAPSSRTSKCRCGPVDTPELGLGFLKRHGNPYALTWLDPQGKGSLAWGVTGVPETFVIDRQGIVRLRHTGPVTAEDLNKRLLPLIEKLKRA